MLCFAKSFSWAQQICHLPMFDRDAEIKFSIVFVFIRVQKSISACCHWVSVMYEHMPYLGSPVLYVGLQSLISFTRALHRLAEPYERSRCIMWFCGTLIRIIQHITWSRGAFFGVSVPFVRLQCLTRLRHPRRSVAASALRFLNSKEYKKYWKFNFHIPV